jgi:hypothetical protein
MLCGIFHQELATGVGFLSKSAADTAACSLRLSTSEKQSSSEWSSDTLLGNAEAGKK